MNITIDSSPQDRDINVIYQGLSSYHATSFPDAQEQSLACYLRDEQGHIVGGVTGSLLYTSFYIKFLWLPETLRGLGYGRQLMTALEKAIMKQGVTHIFVDTFSNQAPNFYLKLDYIETGRLPHFPMHDVDRIYFTKAL